MTQHVACAWSDFLELKEKRGVARPPYTGTSRMAVWKWWNVRCWWLHAWRGSLCLSAHMASSSLPQDKHNSALYSIIMCVCVCWQGKWVY